MDLSKGECAIARLQRLLTMATASSAHLRVSFIRSRGDCLDDFMTLERPLNGDASPRVNVADVERTQMHADTDSSLAFAHATHLDKRFLDYYNLTSRNNDESVPSFNNQMSVGTD